MDTTSCTASNCGVCPACKLGGVQTHPTPVFSQGNSVTVTVDNRRKLGLNGVIELHGSQNEALLKDFYMVTKDCTAAAAIVDLWMMDLKTIFARHGYDLELWERPK